MPHHSTARRSTLRRLQRGLRRFFFDARAAWSDPTIPAATPTLTGYPFDRP